MGSSKLWRGGSSGPTGPVRIKGGKRGGMEKAQAAPVPGEARHSVGWPLKPYNCVRQK